jgi:hypothetical protein
METAPVLVPAPAIVEQTAKPVIIQPPEVSAAHDMAVIGFILTFLLSIPWLLIGAIIGGVGLATYLGYTILPPVWSPFLLSIPYVGNLLLFLGFVLSPSYLVYMGLGGGVLLIALLFLLILYWTTVHNINRGRYLSARNASLLWGVLFIIPTFFVLFAPTQIFGVVVAIIPAFFFLMAYGRLGEVIAKYGPVAIMGEAAPGLPTGPVAPPMPAPMPAMPIAPAMPVVPPGMMPPAPGPVPVPTGAVGPSASPLTHVAPRIPLCPSCGRELYYSANHRRWYCMTCDNPMGGR